MVLQKTIYEVQLTYFSPQIYQPLHVFYEHMQWWLFLLLKYFLQAYFFIF